MYLTQWLRLYFNKSKRIKHAPLFWKYGLNILWSGYLKICLKVQFISILDYNRFHSLKKHLSKMDRFKWKMCIRGWVFWTMVLIFKFYPSIMQHFNWNLADKFPYLWCHLAFSQISQNMLSFYISNKFKKSLKFFIWNISKQVRKFFSRLECTDLNSYLTKIFFFHKSNNKENVSKLLISNAWNS